MRLLRHLQYWLTGGGPHIRVADFVPEAHPVRQWADTFPWAALVAAVDRSVAQRFPPRRRGGGRRGRRGCCWPESYSNRNCTVRMSKSVANCGRIWR